MIPLGHPTNRLCCVGHLVSPSFFSTVGFRIVVSIMLITQIELDNRKAAEHVQFIKHVELSYRSDCNQYFIEHMGFSKENLC